MVSSIFKARFFVGKVFCLSVMDCLCTLGMRSSWHLSWKATVWENMSKIEVFDIRLLLLL
jgi:hypothetical protein